MKTKSLFSAIAILLGSNALAGNLVDVDVLARPTTARYGYAAPLPEYAFRGEQFVEGVAGREFSVRLKNHSAERVLVVLSVDGINAISGQTADYNGTGYVLLPYQTLDVNGWRKSASRTAAFYFTNLADSYGARTGRPQNVGVIGAAVFRERDYWPQPQVYEQPYGRYGKNAERDSEGLARAPSPSASGATDGGRAAEAPEAKSYQSAPIGTGHGRSEYAPSVRVNFERADQVFEVLNLRYDTYNNLVAMGVIPQAYYGNQQPQSFPNAGYTPDPDLIRYRRFRR